MIIEPKYFDNYKLMIELMNNPTSKVVAFLGAGLTRRFGYGNWKELIFGNEEDSDTAKPNCLKGYAELKLEDFEDFKKHKTDLDKYDLLLSAQKCYDHICKLGGKEKWVQFLENKFGNTDSIWVNVNDDPIAHIFYSKYFCFVTTNFDGVLKRYGEKCINNLTIQVYPKNLCKPLEKSLAYLHGAGFKIIENYSPEIILTKDSYEEAYSKKSQMDNFLPELIKYDIVFIGFSMDDKYISEFLIQLENLRIKTIKNNPEVDSSTFIRKRFLILPFQPHTLKDTKDKVITELEMINDEDKQLESQKLLVIRYTKEGDDPHKNFSNLMRHISKEVPNKNLFSKPYDISEAWN